MTIHEQLAAAWRRGGINVVSTAPVSGSNRAPNPTAVAVQVAAGKTVTHKVFAWNITHEGKGRSGDNLRVQATSFGKANSPVQVDSSVLGVGWSAEHGVFVGFDPWVKRNPGSSSSVHIKRKLVEDAASAGIVRGGHTWDPRLGFTPDHAVEMFKWAADLWKQRTISVKALRVEAVDADRVRVISDPWSSTSAWGVRVGDRLAVFNPSGADPNPYLWRVEAIGEVPIVLPSGINRFHYVFTAKKSAKVTGTLEKP